MTKGKTNGEVNIPFQLTNRLKDWQAYTSENHYYLLHIELHIHVDVTIITNNKTAQTN